MYKKSFMLIVAIMLVLSMSQESESAQRFKEIELGLPDDASGTTPESIHEAIELAGEIVEDEDEDIDYESYRNIVIKIPRSYGPYSVTEDDRYINEIRYVENLDSITINGNNIEFEPSDSGERHFELSGRGPAVNFRDMVLMDKDGGGVYVESGYVSFDNVQFMGLDMSEADESQGGALRVSGGEVYVTRSEFNGNRAEDGGAIYVTGGNLTLEGGARANTFRNNEASNSGGVISVTGGNVTITDAIFQTNKAGEAGGAINASGGSVELTSSTFSGNEAAGDGGAINASGATMTLNSGNNFASNIGVNGGAMKLSGTVTINSGNEFTRNSAENGGAIYIQDGRNVNITGSIRIEENSATNGGGVYLAEDDRARLNITGSEAQSFRSNKASSSGGGIYASRYSVLSFGGGAVNFESNTALNGGGLWIYEPGQLPITELNFANNHAEKDGGGLYIAGQVTSTLLLNNTKKYAFRNNTADQSGGAIYLVSSDAEITGIEITAQNNAVRGGGGFLSSNGNVIIEDATISGQQGALGGAIYGAVVQVENSLFSSNRSSSRGGAIYASELVDIQNSTFSNNGSTTTLNTNLGGAIYGLGLVSITKSEFTGNSTSGQDTYQGGGAIYISGDATITNSTFTNNTHRNNENTFNGGGAIYARGSLAMSGDVFTGNEANGNTDSMGGAVFVYSAKATARDVLFDRNHAQGNGGALTLYEDSDADLREVTFTGNMSNGKDGGAVYAQGHAMINLSYFTGNTANGSGGGVYFYQSGNSRRPGEFIINSSMLQSNSALNGQGGALYVNADRSTIYSCTFSNNQSATLSDSRGGGVYFSVEENGTISNSTFTGNEASDGATSYGGALASYGSVTLTMSTFTAGNKATHRGGGIYVGTGTLTISATIVVGNSAILGGDVWSDGSIASRGYNRVGVYGQGSANTSWTSAVGGNTDTDRSNTSWTTSTFFGNGTLGYNARTDTVPPYIGSSLAERERILTLMLSEDATLALNDRATNIIPNNRRYNYPELDQRGVSRWASVHDLSIGAVIFDGDVINPEPGSEGGAFDIQSVMMSGIPNSLRSIGQTASLTAMITYRNGYRAYGVPYDASSVKQATRSEPGEERVRWTSSSNNIVKIDKSGNITALTTTPNNSAVMITVSTVRAGSSGVPATDSRPVRVTGQYTNMNISPEWQNYFMNYIQEITEEDISLMLVDENVSAVRSSSFQRNFKEVWDVTAATHITDLRSSAPLFRTERSYRTSDGKENAKAAAVNINFQGRQTGDIFPLTYTWSFTGDEVKALLKKDLTGETINASLAEQIFEALRVDFAGTSGAWSVIGGSGVRAKDAYTYGALELAKADANRGVRIDLTVYLANVQASGQEDGPQFVKGTGSKRLLIIPDGSADGAIAGTMWMLRDALSGGPSDTNSSRPVAGNGTSDISPKSGEDGGSGGGCNAVNIGVVMLGLAVMLRRK